MALIAAAELICGESLPLQAPRPIAGFGKFKVKETPEREGRNAATGATIKIAASRRLSFATAKAVKDG